MLLWGIEREEDEKKTKKTEEEKERRNRGKGKKKSKRLKKLANNNIDPQKQEAESKKVTHHGKQYGCPASAWWNPARQF